MKSNQIKRSLQNAVADLTPDLYDKVSRIPVLPMERMDSYMTTDKQKSKNVWKKYAGFAVAACLAIVCLSGGLWYRASSMTDSIISIDVNPSIELTTNSGNQVLTVTPMNADGEIILDGMDLRRVDLNVAVNALTGSMVKHGYLTGDGGSILVSVQNKDMEKAERIRASVSTDIQDALEGYHISATVLNQTVSEQDQAIDLRAQAEEYQISYGKAVFLHHLSQKDSTLSIESLADKSFREIATLIQEKNIDISDMIDYDRDDSLYENITDAIEDFDEEQPISTENLISEEEAKEAALQNAGLKASEVTFTKVQLDRDDGRTLYELEFYTADSEYEYEVDAATGQVVKGEKERWDMDD